MLSLFILFYNVLHATALSLKGECPRLRTNLGEKIAIIHAEQDKKYLKFSLIKEIKKKRE